MRLFPLRRRRQRRPRSHVMRSRRSQKSRSMPITTRPTGTAPAGPPFGSTPGVNGNARRDVSPGVFETPRERRRAGGAPPFQPPRTVNPSERRRAGDAPRQPTQGARQARRGGADGASVSFGVPRRDGNADGNAEGGNAALGSRVAGRKGFRPVMLRQRAEIPRTAGNIPGPAPRLWTSVCGWRITASHPRRVPQWQIVKHARRMWWRR